MGTIQNQIGILWLTICVAIVIIIITRPYAALWAACLHCLARIQFRWVQSEVFLTLSPDSP